MKLITFDRKEFQRRYGFDVVSLCAPTIRALADDGLVTVEPAALSLTAKGMRWGDYVGHRLAAALEALEAPEEPAAPCTA
jgi:oxygen-independent coproporphyrinogen-3 oxidase